MDTKSKKNNIQDKSEVMKTGLLSEKDREFFLKLIKKITGPFIRIANKVKSISVNKRIIIISICICLLPIFLAIFNSSKYVKEEEKFNNSDIRNEVSLVCESLDKLNYYLEDSNGNFREAAINSEIDNLKNDNKKDIEDAEKRFEKYTTDNQIDVTKEKLDDYYYNDLKSKIIEAETEYNKNDEEYRKEAVISLQRKVGEIKSLLKKNINVEYYIESTDGNKIANIYGRDADGVERDTINYNSPYKNQCMVYTDIYNNVATSITISDSMKSFSDLMDANNMSAKIIRISNPLKDGDAIYDALKGVEQSSFNKIVSSVIIVIDIIILFIVILLRKRELKYKENKFVKLYSKLFIEIKTIIVIFIIFLLFILFSDMYHNNFWRAYHPDSLIEFAVAYLIMYTLLSNIYEFIFVKRHSIKHKSIILKLYDWLNCKLNTEIKKYQSYNRSKTLKKTMIIFTLIFISSMTLICYMTAIIGFNSPSDDLIDLLLAFGDNGLIIFVLIRGIIIILMAVYMIVTIININNIKRGTDIIIEGNYNEKIKVYGYGVLKDISNNIMNIQAGFDTAIESAVKSEKMKSELITNVSHDLKTPLTSIINYVDLLSKGNLSEEDRIKYLDILNDRSLRLKVLIEDLFEAAKASSGTLEFNYECLDPAALLRQTLGEFEDKIESSGLTIIKNIPPDKLAIIADGKKTFRVIQNLMSNIIKYSLKNSRVYIDIIEEEEYILMVFKNISEYQLNLNEEELLERFKRGDSSRTTEGSGLGLSIAKGLVEAQGGIFKIKIDGDLFKVEIRLRKNK